MRAVRTVGSLGERHHGLEVAEPTAMVGSNFRMRNARCPSGKEPRAGERTHLEGNGLGHAR